MSNGNKTGLLERAGVAPAAPEPKVVDPLGNITDVRMKDGVIYGSGIINLIEAPRPGDKSQRGRSGQSRIVAESISWHPAGVLVKHNGKKFVVPVERIDTIGIE